jgi:hypothetical protein
MNVPRKYGLLRVLAFVLKLIAWLVLLAGAIGTVLALIYLVTGVQNQPGVLQALPLVGTVALPIISIVWWIQLFAFGSILSLLVDIEENTRTLAARTSGPPEA